MSRLGRVLVWSQTLPILKRAASMSSSASKWKKGKKKKKKHTKLLRQPVWFLPLLTLQWLQQHWILSKQVLLYLLSLNENVLLFPCEFVKSWECILLPSWHKSMDILEGHAKKCILFLPFSSFSPESICPHPGTKIMFSFHLISDFHISTEFGHLHTCDINNLTQNLSERETVL